ncbi:UNVERIFIED_CONTAM: Retrovirus-related Pol polyprotein from transposon RE2 [Sesamum calycinum]|uniref:Retrovirus-related Pol polyprotein from transposon RE2 n=1 Tax=Sesamum calycinum TaxID=2727403 RepID=A0AAW2QZ71_9LAMI
MMIGKTTTTNATSSAAPNINAQIENETLQLHGADHPGMVLVSVPLTGKNYLNWSHAIKRSLRAKMKLGFIDGTLVKPDVSDAAFEKWIRVDSMVTTWILNLISKDIVEALCIQSLRGLYGFIWMNDMKKKMVGAPGKHFASHTEGRKQSQFQGDTKENLLHELVKLMRGTVEPHVPHQQANKDTHWVVAMNLELQALEQNGTWELTSLPPDKRTIGSRWVFKLKLNPDGSIDRYKARLVAKGYNQIKGVDYFDSASC